MNRRTKDSGPHFKRILSHSSSTSGGGNIDSRRQDVNDNAKKCMKLKTTSPELDHNCGNCADCEPLLNNHFSTSPTDIPRNEKYSRRIKPQPKTSCGHLPSLDFRQDCSRGIMSVTDIELTMGDDDHNGVNFLSPGSPRKNDYSSASSNSSSMSFSLARCVKVSCDENTCLWHLCVLKLPQHVRWEDRIITIELQRKNGESFGFNYKSKQHLGKDEIYTLVSRVDENSKAAKSGLAIGDLILSANNVAMQTQQKIPEIDLSTQTKLRLLIQHPLELSSKAANQVEQLRASMMRIHEMSNRCYNLPQPPTPSTSPTSIPLSPGENIPLCSLSRPETKITSCYHQLPLVRIFVCGNATNDFIRNLINDFIPVFDDETPRCIQISMKKSVDGLVSISNSESFSYLFETSSEQSINVELVTAADDRFFHHCGSWMFTQNSIFILTFDTNRLSHSSEAEMSHLSNLVHTVQTGISGNCSNLKLYGITYVEDGMNPEEVQTLFSTSHGNSLPHPKVIPFYKGALREEMKDIRQDLFSMLIEICGRQQVMFPTAIALDMLMTQRQLFIMKKDLAKTLEDSNLDSKEVGPELLYKVVEDLINTGNLLVTASLNAACVSEDMKEFVLPCVLFDHLSRLVLCTEQDRASVKHEHIWTTLYSTGIITRPEFLEILASCTADPQKVLSCMEDLHLVFPVRVLGQDSGLGQDDDLLFPYYLQDSCCNSQADNYELYMTVEFSANIPVSVFFLLLSEISQSDHCYSFKMRAQYVGHLILNGEDFCFSFKKTERRIEVLKNRSSRQTHYGGKQTVPQEIQHVLVQQIPSSVMLKVRLFSEANEATSFLNEKKVFFDEMCLQSGVDSELRLEEDEDREKTVVKFPVDPASSLLNTPDGATALPNVPLSQPHFPIGLIMNGDNISGAVLLPGDDARHELNDAEREEQRVLDTNMQDLLYIYRELYDIEGYVSVSSVLQQLACECGLTMADWEIYQTLIKNESNKLPGQVFLETYFRENCVTLREFLQILYRMVEQKQHYHLYEKVKNLWIASLRGNSQFGGHSHNPSC